jgi:hypothetical protein
MKVVLAGAMILALGACAAPMQQTQAPAFDPAGSYDFTTQIQGSTVRGVLTLRRTDQGLTGSIVTDVTGELLLTHVALEGRRAELRAATDEGGMIMHIDFAEDNTIVGGWQVDSGLSGSLTGQRRTQ